ncbi:MAG: hypothetical protein U0U70_14925 [Chitinophagaceae bacterium]
MQYTEDEMTAGKSPEEEKKSNPFVYDISGGNDSLLVTRFKALGLIRDNEFLPKKFKKQTSEQTSLTDSRGNVFKIKFYQNKLSGHIHFSIVSPNDSLDTDTNSIALQNLDYAFIDVIPGGNKELVYLDDYYFMNGDNFDFLVYEIITR